MAQGGGDGGLMACQLTLAATAGHRPGDTVTALLQVSCSQPEAVERRSPLRKGVGSLEGGWQGAGASGRRAGPPCAPTAAAAVWLPVPS
jgi:hypothetical protein